MKTSGGMCRFLFKLGTGCRVNHGSFYQAWAFARLYPVIVYDHRSW
ncbi:MAG TPA: hypothetical protein VE689_05100 [Candidatus Udaeobacter sp.]|nr:hypothetical protein [Candidatus Udaeobacter sp.]